MHVTHRSKDFMNWVLRSKRTQNLTCLVAFKEHENDPRIPEVCADMAKEMGEGNYYADLNVKMAQFELTLLDWAEAHKGSKKIRCIC